MSPAILARLRRMLIERGSYKGTPARLGIDSDSPARIPTGFGPAQTPEVDPGADRGGTLEGNASKLSPETPMPKDRERPIDSIPWHFGPENSGRGADGPGQTGRTDYQRRGDVPEKRLIDRRKPL